MKAAEQPRRPPRMTAPHLERQLAAVQHLPPQRICLPLQVGLGLLPGGQQLPQDLRQQARPQARLHEQVTGRRPDVLVRRQAAAGRGVFCQWDSAQVMVRTKVRQR